MHAVKRTGRVCSQYWLFSKLSAKGRSGAVASRYQRVCYGCYLYGFHCIETYVDVFSFLEAELLPPRFTWEGRINRKVHLLETCTRLFLASAKASFFSGHSPYLRHDKFGFLCVNYGRTLTTVLVT